MIKFWLKLKLWFDRFLSKSLWKQFVLVFAFLVLALIFSYLILPVWSDNWKDICNANHINKWLLPIYLLVDSNAFNNIYIDDSEEGNLVTVWTLIASTTSFLLGAFIFNGFIIAIITNSIERRVTNYKEGRIHYLKSEHYVIMGYDDMVPSFVKYIFKKNTDAFVLILTSSPVIEVKDSLSKSFGEIQMKRIIVNCGYRITEDSYKEIHLEKCLLSEIMPNQPTMLSMWNAWIASVNILKVNKVDCIQRASLVCLTILILIMLSKLQIYSERYQNLECLLFLIISIQYGPSNCL